MTNSEPDEPKIDKETFLRVVRAQAETMIDDNWTERDVNRIVKDYSDAIDTLRIVNNEDTNLVDRFKATLLALRFGKSYNEGRKDALNEQLGRFPSMLEPIVQLLKSKGE